MSNKPVLVGSNTAELQSFFNGMDYYLTVSKEAKQRLDKELASSFSLFDYIHVNEAMISRSWGAGRTCVANLSMHRKRLPAKIKKWAKPIWPSA